jgi:broad specificity phosphatase PhoE
MIYLIRHGVTEWNKMEVFRGKKDVPLSPEGREQARSVARYLSSFPITRVYSSPLSRAYETASIIATTICCEVTPLEGLSDVDFGNWEGKPLRWVKKNYSREYRQYRLLPASAQFPGGESLEACRARAFAAFIETIASDPEANLVLLSHRVIIKLLLLELLGLSTNSFWKIRIDTCGINEVNRTEDGFIIHRINSTVQFSGEMKIAGDF